MQSILFTHDHKFLISVVGRFTVADLAFRLGEHSAVIEFFFIETTVIDARVFVNLKRIIRILVVAYLFNSVA